MPLRRLLLPLCGLLLVLAVTAATASAPLYGTDEITLSGTFGYGSLTRDEQIAKCVLRGGSLVPMVTDAVYTLVLDVLMQARMSSFFSYMGASTMLSSEECTTSSASLDCIWYWDQGRYTGADNAVAFYNGNRGSAALSGAGMIGTSVDSHWRVLSDGARCPCDKMERYGAFLRGYMEATPYWSDSSSTSYTYSTGSDGTLYSLCAVDRVTTTTTTTTTTTVAPPVTVAPTTAAPTTTTAEPSEEGSGVNVPLVVGLSVAAAVVLIATIAIIVSIVCCGGCSCIAGRPGVATASSSGTMSRGSFFSSRGSSGSDAGRRFFRGGELSKRGSSRRSSSRTFEDDAVSWRNDEEMSSCASLR